MPLDRQGSWRSRSSRRLAYAVVCTAFSAALLPAQANAGLQRNIQAEQVSPSSGEPLDINTASAAQLRALPGMGDAYVRRILEGRPYTAKNQLVTRGVLPAAAYERIRDQIVAHRLQKKEK